MKVKYPDVPSLGNIEAEFFEPWKWKTEYPQPAFNLMDDADAFWAASIVSRFSDEMIRAIVDTGRLSNERAAKTLADIIIKRRDKVVAYWLTRTNPLDRFEVSSANGNVASGLELSFDNAAIRSGVASDQATYAARWFALDNNTGAEQSVGDEVTLNDTRARVPESAWGPRDDAGDRYTIAAIRTMHDGYPTWQRPVTVTLRERQGAIEVVGIERARLGNGLPDSRMTRR
jgi:hypothetical protein